MKKGKGMLSLFEEAPETYAIPVLKEGPYDQAFDEIELLGFPLCSPFDLLQSSPTGTILAADMYRYVGRRAAMTGYLVTRKYVTTVKREQMNFGTWLDRDGLFFDSTHFPVSLAQFPFRGKGIYLMYGRIVLDFDFPMMEVERMDKLPLVKDERY